MSEPFRAELRLGEAFASIDPNAELKADGFRYDAYGPGPFKGWYPVRFKLDVPASVFMISQPHDGDVHLLIRAEAIDESAMSADATKFSGDLASQFGLKPDVPESAWGGYEAWNGWTLGTDGIDIVLVQYTRDGQKYTSCNLTVVKL